MNELIKKIEETVSDLFRYDMDAYVDHAQAAVDLMTDIFPRIIACYSDPRMSDHAEDAAYWPAQLNRIVDAFNGSDDMSVLDILYNETRANLIELDGILKDKGISL